MKSILTVLLAITSFSVTLAQNKNNIFLDAGVNERGLAATYDRELTRHFDIGAGINTYVFNWGTVGKVRSALYLDLRPYWIIRKSMLFVLADVGAAYKSGPMRDSSSITHMGLYTALAGGYQYRINKRGMGPYVSLGLYGYTLSVHSSRANLPPRVADYSVFDAVLILSLGFKF